MDFFKTYALKDIASIINARVVGDENMEVKGINEIHKIKNGELAFVDHPKYYDKVIDSAASAVIIDKEIPSKKPLLVCDVPIDAFNTLVNHFMPFEMHTNERGKMNKIADSAQIFPGVIIGNDVEIGEGSIIYPNVVIYDHVKIGNNVIIHANSTLGSDAFYYNRKKEQYKKLITGGRLIIEDDVEIGSNCTLDKGVSGNTIIGEGTKIDNQVQIAHGVEIGKNCLVASQVGIAGKTIIEDDVKIWGQVGIISSIRIGAGAEIYAQSGVSTDLAGNKKYFGSPAEEARIQMRILAALKKLPELLKKV